MKDNKIVWQKCIDPFLLQVEGIFREEARDRIDTISSVGYLDNGYENIEEEKEIESVFNDAINENIEMMESFRPDLWIIHTNFDITDAVVKIISNTPGVDAVYVLSRYRIIIGIPRSKLFDFRVVRHEIQRKLCDNNDIVLLNETLNENEETEEEILKRLNETKALISKNEYWAIWMLPNGNIETLSSDKKDEVFYEEFAVFKNGHTVAGGIIITSDNLKD